MKGYCIFNNVRVHDLEKLEAYKKEAGTVVRKFGGQYIVAGGQFSVVEGSWVPTFLVIIEFPSFENACQWYYSEEYKELKSVRLSVVASEAVIVEGV